MLAGYYLIIMLYELIIRLGEGITADLVWAVGAVGATTSSGEARLWTEEAMFTICGDL